MAERFTADVNLTVPELSELCDITSDLIINALNGTQPTSPERVEILKSLFNKAHEAWGRQVIAAEISNVLAAAAATGRPVPPEVAAYMADEQSRGAIPLEVPGAEPHECGHWHAEGTECPDEPCGDYRCCIG